MLSVFKNINFKDSVSSITPCDVLLFCHDADRGVTLNQLPYSPLMDSLGDELKAEDIVASQYLCLGPSSPVHWHTIIRLHITAAIFGHYFKTSF